MSANNWRIYAACIMLPPCAIDCISKQPAFAGISREIKWNMHIRHYLRNTLIFQRLNIYIATVCSAQKRTHLKQIYLNAFVYCTCEYVRRLKWTNLPEAVLIDLVSHRSLFTKMCWAVRFYYLVNSVHIWARCQTLFNRANKMSHWSDLHLTPRTSC